MVSTVVSEFIARDFFYVFLAIIFLTVYERKFGWSASRKRMATLIQGIAVFLVGSVAAGIMEFGGSDLHLLLAVLVIGAVVAFPLRSRAFPYQRTCPSCNTRLDYNTILFRDDNLCESCRPEAE